MNEDVKQRGTTGEGFGEQLGNCIGTQHNGSGERMKICGRNAGEKGGETGAVGYTQYRNGEKTEGMENDDARTGETSINFARRRRKAEINERCPE